MKCKLVICSCLLIVVMCALCACSVIRDAELAADPDGVIVGTWEKETDVGLDALGISLGKVTISYVFYEDGTCVQSTDFGQTSRWILLNDHQVKITTPLNFTETLDLRYDEETDSWWLGDYKKVG